MARTQRIAGGTTIDPALRRALEGFATAVVRLSTIDPVTTEIVRGTPDLLASETDPELTRLRKLAKHITDADLEHFRQWWEKADAGHEYIPADLRGVGP